MLTSRGAYYIEMPFHKTALGGLVSALPALALDLKNAP
jgi:hypothetical protein